LRSRHLVGGTGVPVSPFTGHAYLKRLEAAGFVRREIDSADLRRHRLLLTPAGRQATKDGLALLSDAFNQRLERLTNAQQKELKRLLEQIL
jgi:MarR family transcriptional regulator, temperature-dependent positive regulator of motility